MKFSIKSFACLFVWLSFVFALFAMAKADAIPANTFATRTTSEILLLANFGFTICVIALAVGSFPNRFWLATSIVAAILAYMQISSLLPTAVLQRTVGVELLARIATPPAGGNQVWLAEHSSELSNLMLYSLTPVVSLLCGRLAVWNSNANLNS